VVYFELRKSKDSYPFDFIISSEMLEHVVNWQTALHNIISNTKKFALITIPSGKLYDIDKKVGHLRHYNRKMITSCLGQRTDCTHKIFFWGFPFQQLYKFFINVNSDKIYRAFAQKKYSWRERTVSNLISMLFYMNLKTEFETNQLFVLITKVR
jgi:hypothetical protein